VQIFMAYDWKVVGRFILLGSPDANPTGTPTFTPIPPAAAP